MTVKEAIRSRWSPRKFSSEQIEDEKLEDLFTHLRWAASSRNEQPWRLVVGKKGSETWDIICNSLMDGNKEWAQNAPVLILISAHKYFQRNYKPNKHARYDSGQAVGTMLLRATELGLIAHQMGGFMADKISDDLNIPEEIDPIAVMALGYSSEEPGERNRNDVEHFVRWGKW